MRVSTSVALISIFLSAFIVPDASAITSGSCNVTVGSASGVVLVNNGGYCYLAFSNTGANSFTVPSGITSAAVLVVAGGGGGGSGAWGGGGGAGGVVTATSYPLTPGATMNLSVGAGGATGTASTDSAVNRSQNGDDSWINSSSTFVAKGGGAGASFAYYSTTTNSAGSAGGSGGGGTENSGGGVGGATTQTTPTYATSVWGSAGGSTPALNNTSGAGGGGAGGVGVNNTTSGTGGAGGPGISSFSSWFTAIGQFGVNGFIAGGGGGGTSTTRGAGGSGGGGVGADQTNTTAGNGAANTGSGGGGATYVTGALLGGSGGSGLIIFRFTAVVNPAVINTPTTSGAIYKGITTTISVTMDSPGAVQFFANNKRIGKCVSVSTTGSSPNYSASCSWKPTTSGTQLIKAQLTPSNGAQSVQPSATKSVQVLRRSTRR
jgi:hypothetical protein